MRQQIRVKCNASVYDFHKKRLTGFGLVYGEGYFYGTVSGWKLRKIRRYCSEEKLRLDISSGFTERSGYYRRKFMATHNPQIGPFYICAYCGKLLLKKNVTVDHLYPVKEAARDPRVMKKLRRMKIYNVNDQKNLVCACEHCNKKKAAKMGLWVIRGKIGRHTWVWIIRYLVRVGILSAAAWIAWNVMCS